MPSESTLYCFRRKKDAEKLAEHINIGGGNLGYCTARIDDGTYSVYNPLNSTNHKFNSYGEMLEFILRKWW